ncbi:MAG: hypothetical protein LBN95_02400 [Prevotellaceae bacterium]|jgi:hypothetical protein|nr:hypothetical protein [Prevotellaceae bacterium]
MMIDPDGNEALEFTTDYYNDKGELLYHTDDGLKDAVIVPDAKIPELQAKLQEAKDNGTINNPETNKKELHTLGQTTEQYANQKTNGMGADWTAGYNAEYTRTYNGEKRSVLSTIIDIVAHVSEDYLNFSGGERAGKSDGKNDRKEGKINRLDPRSSLKNNLPKIKLKDKN